MGNLKIGFTKKSVLVAGKDQVSAALSPDLPGNVVILGLKDGIYYELEEVGARIWSLIQKPCSIQFLLDTLLKEYEVDAQRCEADLLALAEDMAKRDLIKIK